jgi:microcystin-dependent protein
MDPFVGQLMLVGFNFAPIGFALAQGQTLSISSNTALFSLLGTTYGGDGRSNFKLPNMQGNVAVGFGQGPGLSLYDLGETGGSQTVTLLVNETPLHTHTAQAKNIKAEVNPPAGHSLADSSSGNIYTNTTTPLVPMSPNAISPFGGNQPHNNMMPYVGLNWVIALQGVFPARS